MTLTQTLLNSASRITFSPDESGSVPAAAASEAASAEASGRKEAPAAGGEGDVPDLGGTDLGAAKDEKLNEDGTAKDKPAAEGEAKPDEAAKEGEKKPDEAKAEDAKEGDLDLSALKPPEGFEGLEADLVEKAKPIFAKLGIKDVAAAQDVLNSVSAEIIAPMIAKAVTAGQSSVWEAVRDQRADWLKTSKADKEIGGNDKNYAETLQLGARFLDTFGATLVGKDGKPVKDKDGNPINELRAYLDETGLGNHPAVMRAFRKAGEALGEDKSPRGGDASAQRATRLQDQLYPRTAKP